MKIIGSSIIAEIGSVHDGSFGNACKLIELAVECGADVAKFQTHIPEAETLRNAPNPSFFKGEPRFEYFQRTGFSETQWIELAKCCHENNIEFMSSPFSIEAVELLEKIGLKRYKIPSGEVTNLPLLSAAAQTGKPVILSSGMSSWGELDDAVNTIVNHASDLTILQCTSEYPCPYEDVGLNIMIEMRERYKVPVGLSDHTLTPFASFAAVTLGASLIEKHLTFSRKMYGSDARHSLEPAEFKELVNGIRAIEIMLSTPVRKDEITSKMMDMKQTFEKSIVSLVDIPKGTIIEPHMVGMRKPGTGLPSKNMNLVIGMVALRDIKKDEQISLDVLNA